jgi:peptide/nickel transport system permease protein
MKRLLHLIPLLLAISFLSYMLVYISPSSPAEIILKASYSGDATPAQIERFNRENGLDQPVLVQYKNWLSKACMGDLGKSLINGEDVLQTYFVKLKASFGLFFLGQILSIMIAIPVGVYSAYRSNSAFDHLSRTGTIVGISIPDFWLGMLLVFMLSIKIHIFPSFGYGKGINFVLPVLALGISGAASLTRMVRTCVIETLGANYVRTARAKGVSNQNVLFRHALRNALLPVVTLIGIRFTHLFSGSIVIESLFAWPGLGRYFLEISQSKDIISIQGFVLMSALLFVLVNLAVDIVYLRVDPRIQLQTKGG